MSARLQSVRLYLASGGYGSVRDIAHALEIPAVTARWALKTLAARGEAEKVGQRLVQYTGSRGASFETAEAIWGALGCAMGYRPPPNSLVGRALASRPPLQQVWAA